MQTKTTFFTTIMLIIISACSSQVWAQSGTDDPDHACLNSTEDYWVIDSPGSTYDWVLSGGGTIMGGQGTSAISINWTSEGTFVLSVTETLTGTTHCSGAPVTLNIIVDPLPLATAAANTPNAGDDLNLTGGPAGMASYEWTGPGGFTSTLQNPVITDVTTDAAGVYTLTVTNSAGCSATATVNVTVIPVDHPSASANTPCVGGDLILTGGPSGMTSYSWTGPDGFSSSEQSPAITAVTSAAAGTYTLTVTNSSGASSSATVDVTINPLPAPVITGSNMVCQSIDGSTEIYSTPDVAGSTFAWTVVGGTFSGQGSNQIAVTWTTPGTGSVSVTETVTSTGCSATATIGTTIQPAPVTSGIYHN
ncbi:MAG: hypothetical protein RBU28_10300 [Bacteroidales bacterium]|jgi:hypothetical protein|nr:hypothetical protein [Bacteroidales bacterium]